METSLHYVKNKVRKRVKIIRGIEQGTEEWLDIRKGKITGTTINTILCGGVGCEKEMKKVAGERITNFIRDYGTSFHTERGKKKEPEAALYYEILKGVSTEEVTFISKNDWIGFSPDRLVGYDGGLEIKRKTEVEFMDFCMGKKPDKKILDQVYFALWVTGRAWWDLAYYNERFDNPMHVIRYKPDFELFKQIEVSSNSFIAKAEKYISQYELLRS